MKFLKTKHRNQEYLYGHCDDYILINFTYDGDLTRVYMVLQLNFTETCVANITYIYM